MEKVQTPPAMVEDLRSFKGQYLRHMREQTVWKVVDVGREGVTVYQVTHYGGDELGPETTLTWNLVKAMYAIMVHAGEIDTKEIH